MSTPSDVPGIPGIAYVLKPEPAMGKSAYRADASCPHGASTHIVFGRNTTFLEQAPLLAPAHRANTRCGCQVVSVDLKAAAGGSPA